MDGLQNVLRVVLAVTENHYPLLPVFVVDEGLSTKVHSPLDPGDCAINPAKTARSSREHTDRAATVLLSSVMNFDPVDVPEDRGCPVRASISGSRASGGADDGPVDALDPVVEPELSRRVSIKPLHIQVVYPQKKRGSKRGPVIGDVSPSKTKGCCIELQNSVRDSLVVVTFKNDNL